MTKYYAEVVQDPSKPKKENVVRLMCLSDSHGHHEDISKDKIFPADILLCAGDFTILRNPHDASSFKNWIESLPCQHKIVIPGNLDLTFDTQKIHHFQSKIIEGCKARNTPISDDFHLESVKQDFLKNASFNYIENSVIEINNVKIFGSPFTAEFMDWVFQFPGDEGKGKYNIIPENVDIFLTHGPPRGICDKSKAGVNCGDEELLNKIEQLKPALSIFGHIHEAHGNERVGETLCCNVAVVNENRVVVHGPTYIDLSLKE